MHVEYLRVPTFLRDTNNVFLLDLYQRDGKNQEELRLGDEFTFLMS